MNGIDKAEIPADVYFHEWFSGFQPRYSKAYRTNT